MRSVRALALGFVLLAGCKPEPFRPDAAPPYWKPAPGEYADWDIQVGATPDISMPRKMYTLDLWKVVPAPTTLDYGNNMQVTVPAGSLSNAITDLHSRPSPAIVICQVATGTIRLDDPDAMMFPGYEASPPNRPTPVASGSVIGWSRPGAADDKERFIDIRDNDQRSKVAALIGKRIELARTIGCDAIGVQHNSLPLYEGNGDHGFIKIEFNEYTSWMTELSTRAHDMRLSIGVRNGTGIDIDQLVLTYDWIMEDRCAEGQGYCDQMKPFVSRSKAAFAVNYLIDADGNPITKATICEKVGLGMIEDAIIKDMEFSSAPPDVCSQ